MLNVINGRIILENKEVKKNLYIKDGIIKAISKDVFEGEIIDAKGQLVTAGFIDIHCHGGQDMLFAHNPEIALKAHKRRGTLGILPTIGYNMEKDIFIEGVSKIAKMEDEAILGINCEGPFINPEYGADTKNARKIDEKEFIEIYKGGEGKIRIWTFSPDIINTKIFKDFLKTKKEIIPCGGHTECSKEQLEGIKLICHLFDAMGPKKRENVAIHETGTAEFVMTDKYLYAELIADSKAQHVSSTLLKLAHRAMGDDKVILISDAIGTKQDYSNNDLNYNELGQLSGSLMSVNLAVCNMVKHTKISWPQAVKMATLNPATLLGVEKTIGSIAIGKKANIVVMSENGEVYHVIENGRIYDE